MAKKRIVIAIGHKDLGTNLPEQKAAVAKTAKVIADFIQESWQVAIVHSNAPQVGMIHTAMNEFGKQHDGYSRAPMSVCSAMSQGYIGYDLQNGIRSELLRRGIQAAWTQAGAGRILLHAQTYARGFYERLGFQATPAPEFLEDGIPHVEMVLERGQR